MPNTVEELQKSILKQGDTKDRYSYILKDDDGANLNLSNATVTAHIASKTALILTKAVTIIDPIKGIISFGFTVADNLPSGRYDVEFMVEFNNGYVETFPETNYLTLEVIPNLRGRGTGGGSPPSVDFQTQINNLASRLEEVEENGGGSGGSGINTRYVNDGELFTISLEQGNTAPSISSTFAITDTDDKTSISISYNISDAQDTTFTATYTKDGSQTTTTVGAGANTWNVGILNAGTHTLTIKVTDSEGAVSNTLSFPITVIEEGANVAVTGITLNQSSISIYDDQTQQLIATVSPSNATNKTVSWSSSNTGVATVNSSGLVTAVSAGSATITVTTNDGNKTATASITITQAPIIDDSYNAYREGNYLYVNPETALPVDISQRTEGEAGHIYFSMSTFIKRVNVTTTHTYQSAETLFNNIIPFAGEMGLNDFYSGSFPDTCYITYLGTIYFRYPASAYASNGNNIAKGFASIVPRLPIYYPNTNVEYIIGDTIIDSLTQLYSVVENNGFWTGFAGLSSAMPDANIVDNINSISGRFNKDTVIDRENWFINVGTRLNFRIPVSKLGTCNLATIKQYLRDNQLIFWIAK